MARPFAPTWLVLALFSSSVARAHVPCASDGPPLFPDEEGYAPANLGAIDPSASVTLTAVPYAGDDAQRRFGDPAQGTDVNLERARVGVCGVADRFVYRLLWEPWDRGERAHADAQSWGRITDAQFGLLPVSWAVVAAGIGKVPFSRGREQPVGALPLALLPYSVAALAPDRRLGLVGDFDLGVFRSALGVFQSDRLSDLDHTNGVLLSARAELEPWGPVARRAWPEYGEWSARPRPATGLTGAYLYDRNGSGYALGADLAFAWKRLFLDGEILFGNQWPLERATIDLATAQARARRLGAYVEALWVIASHLSVATRGEFVDEDLDRPGRGRYFAVAGGANFYLFGPSLQLQATYTQRIHLESDYADGVLLFALTVAR